MISKFFQQDIYDLYQDICLKIGIIPPKLWCLAYLLGTRFEGTIFVSLDCCCVYAVVFVVCGLVLSSWSQLLGLSNLAPFKFSETERDAERGPLGLSADDHQVYLNSVSVCLWSWFFWGCSLIHSYLCADILCPI